VNTSKEIDEQFELRAYLLGMCEGADKKEIIEERLLLDEDYFQQFLLQEEELIDDYINDELDADERRFFESHFLISDERREKVKITILLKDIIDEESDVLEIAGGNTVQKKWIAVRRFFTSPIPIGISILVILGIFVLWWNFNYSLDVQQKALNSLNKAYAGERPFASRISRFDYAPFIKNRNQDEAEVNSVEQNRAERISLDEVAENPTAKNQHLLARVYLAKKDFDKALQQLAEAQKKSPQDAEILNDIGAAYLEKSRLASKDEEKLMLVANAVESFDKALAINPNLLPARFNKAVATEIYLPNRAKEAWQEYLNLDQTSNWAKEARNRLEALNKQETQNITTTEELESAFLEAYREKNDEKAFQLVSQNRELINGKYLPQKFAMALVNKKKTIEMRKSNS
jgi:cytochrome c-type biogenesis protein CcmH/NrfG